MCKRLILYAINIWGHEKAERNQKQPKLRKTTMGEGSQKGERYQPKAI